MESLPAGEEVPMGSVTAEEAIINETNYSRKERNDEVMGKMRERQRPKEDVITVENDAEDEDSPAAKKPKLDEPEAAPVQKKRRSGGQRNRCDTDIIAEARAAYGEMDTSEGRRLRKRPEPKETPPKKPAAKKSTTPRGRKKQVTEESVKEEDAAKPEDAKTEETENVSAAEADTAEQAADVKEPTAGEDVTAAETEEEKPALTEPEPTGGLEAAAASTLPDSESAAEHNSGEEMESQVRVEPEQEAVTDCTAVSATSD